jgi:hypothetical protein
MEMNRGSRFNHRIWTVAAVSAAFLVPLCVFGAPALAKTASAVSEYGHSGSSQYQYKVTICHRTHSKKHPFVQISVGSNAAKSHLRHGDTVGACPAVVPKPVPPVAHQGDDGDHHGNGQGDDNKDNKSKGGDQGHGNGHGHGK